MSAPLERIVQQALAAGILPAGAKARARDNRPWPLVLLSALGAWLAALPLLFGLGILLGDALMRGPAPYVLGVLMLLAVALVFRAPGLALFVEQLALPALLVGLGMLAYALGRDLPVQLAALLLAALAGVLARLLPRDWLRTLLGAAAALLLVAACVAGRGSYLWSYSVSALWQAWHLALAVWIAGLWLQRRLGSDGAGAPHAALLECFGAGWLFATLAGLAFWSGMTFLVGGNLGVAHMAAPGGEFGAPGASGWLAGLMRLASAALALAAAAWLARAWPGLRQWWLAGVALVLVGLAWLLPALGALWLALALCASQGRWRSAAAAACAAAWVVGSFYYQLHWPLATKAMLLLGAALALGALAWLGRPGAAPAAGSDAAPAGAAPARADARRRRIGIVACALAVLAVANGGIWQKEQLIAHGRPVYVELAPVDPRSLMQGDYMRLNFPLPENLSVASQYWGERRPQLVAQVDARGVATLKRVHDGAALAAGEMLIELTPKDGRWVLVTDAWFFKEGEAERWSRAKYGEFRVGADGRALLVGMRGRNLEKL